MPVGGPVQRPSRSSRSQLTRVEPSRAESKDSAKVELINRVGHKLPRIDRFDRLDRFRGLVKSPLG